MLAMRSTQEVACVQGLGKTLQTISFISYLTFERKVTGPSLVVVPLSVVSSWMLEFSRWAPRLRIVRFHTNDVDERKRLRQEVRPQGHSRLRVRFASLRSFGSHTPTLRDLKPYTCPLGGI